MCNVSATLPQDNENSRYGFRPSPTCFGRAGGRQTTWGRETLCCWACWLICWRPWAPQQWFYFCCRQTGRNEQRCNSPGWLIRAPMHKQQCRATALHRSSMQLTALACQLGIGFKAQYWILQDWVVWGAWCNNTNPLLLWLTKGDLNETEEWKLTIG